MCKKTPKGEQYVASSLECIIPLSSNDLIQTQNEYREIEPLAVALGVDFTNIKKRYGKPIDFELEYDCKKIGIEVTDIRPYLEIHKISKHATESAVERVIKQCISDSYISQHCQFDILLKEEAYCAKHIQQDVEFLKEIKEYLCTGTCEHPKFIGRLSKREYPSYESSSEIFFNFQYEGFLKQVPLKCVCKAIYKKEKKLPEYKALPELVFDEYWLCIGLPLEERGYTIDGINMCGYCMSEYDRVFITQSLPPKVFELYRK